jgi:hypothetical protein
MADSVQKKEKEKNGGLQMLQEYAISTECKSDA